MVRPVKYISNVERFELGKKIALSIDKIEYGKRNFIRWAKENNLDITTERDAHAHYRLFTCCPRRFVQLADSKNLAWRTVSSLLSSFPTRRQLVRMKDDPDLRAQLSHSESEVMDLLFHGNKAEIREFASRNRKHGI